MPPFAASRNPSAASSPSPPIHRLLSSSPTPYAPSAALLHFPHPNSRLPLPPGPHPPPPPLPHQSAAPFPFPPPHPPLLHLPSPIRRPTPLPPPKQRPYAASTTPNAASYPSPTFPPPFPHPSTAFLPFSYLNRHLPSNFPPQPLPTAGYWKGESEKYRGKEEIGSRGEQNPTQPNEPD